MDIPTLTDGDRVTHSVRGLGTICISPDTRGLVVLNPHASDEDPGRVYVIWDDERFPVESIEAATIEPLPVCALAMSSGI